MAKLDDKLAALATMSPVQLRDTWRSLMGNEPPRFSVDLLRHAIGYKLQENALGGLSGATLRTLRKTAGGGSEASALKPGTKLMRSWHGRTIAVTVTDDGFEHDGQAYSSLTAIAREVTGAGWSGPRFFGLQAGQGAFNG